MKTNEEVVAAVFEKSKIVVQKRKEQRKKIISASSTLGAVIIITVVAFIGKSLFIKDIVPPVSSVTSVISDSSSSSSDLTDTDSNPVSDTEISVSKSENTSHQSESEKSTDSQTASSQKESSSKAEEKSSKKEVSSSNNKTSSLSSGQNHVTTTITTHEAHEDGSDSASSKTMSSKTTSSKITSSKTTSSKTTSSKTTSSQPDSNIDSDYSHTNSETIITTDSETTSDIDSPTSDIDVPNRPDNPINDTDEETVDSDSSDAKSFYNVFYENSDYKNNATDLVTSADRVIIGYVQNIDFISMDSGYEFLKNYIIGPDIDQDENRENPYGDVVAVYTISIEQELTPSSNQEVPSNEQITVFAYGGSRNTHYFEQSWAVGNAEMIPVVENMNEIFENNSYIFLISEIDGLNTLTNYDQNIYSLNGSEPQIETKITAQDIITACAK